MIKVLLCGCNGKMGNVVAELINEDSEVEIVAGLDSKENDSYDFPVFTSFSDLSIKADVIIDFSHHSITSDLIEYCVKSCTPAVICTTGLDDNQVKLIEEASNSVALFRSGNMSLGVNLVMDLAKKAAEILYDSFDIEIIEKHHNRKLDAPSGTAYMLAESINEGLPNKKNYNYGRSGTSAKRQENEIGIHAIRGGTIVGEHTIIFAGNDELIEIKHTALSRKIFANGAIKAAKFLSDKSDGLYNMNNILK